MIFGTTLDGLATRNTVGSERDARETQRWGAAFLAAVGVKLRRRPRSDSYKAPFISSLSSCVMLYLATTRSS
jgi:hypothetical protein